MASKSRASTASFVLAALEPASLHAHVQILGGQRARALLDAANGRAQMLRQPPAGERAHHQRDAEMVSEMAGRLSAPKMLGRRGTESTV